MKTKLQIVGEIQAEINKLVNEMGKRDHYILTQSSVLKPVVDGIVNKSADIISQENEKMKEKLNETISNVNYILASLRYVLVSADSMPLTPLNLIPPLT